MTDPTYVALLAAVCAAPWDHQRKLVLADWLEEQGDPACEAWRWLGVKGNTENGFMSLNYEYGSFEASYNVAVTSFLSARRNGWTPDWPVEDVIR